MTWCGGYAGDCGKDRDRGQASGEQRIHDPEELTEFLSDRNMTEPITLRFFIFFGLSLNRGMRVAPSLSESSSVDRPARSSTFVDFDFVPRPFFAITIATPSIPTIIKISYLVNVPDLVDR